MRIRHGLWATALLAVGLSIGGSVLADTPSSPTSNPTTAQTVVNSTPSTAPSTSPSGAAPEQLKTVEVSAFEEKVLSIPPELGATETTLGPQQIATTPGGENATFQQVLLRAPGVVPDSFGQEHVRGEHANLTYRVNGVLLPQPLSVFGQELDTHLIQSSTLIDGALPAQFGFHTAGIVDVQTKSGDTLKSNELSLYGGMYDTIDPSLEIGGSDGKFDYFVSASYIRNGLGIENPTATHRPLHDYTDQEKLFGYFAYNIDDTSRLTLLVNGSYSDFQIPNTPGLTPQFTLAGHPTAESGLDNENQNEQEYYTVLAYQKTEDKLSFQLAAFSRYDQLAFQADPINDLIFSGAAASVYNNFVTNGVQFDSSYILNDDHTIRSGFVADYTSENLGTTTGVFPVNGSGQQTSDDATFIGQNSSNNAWEAGAYVQDEWKLSPNWTFNYGARFDGFVANFDTEDQLSPRANLVWKPDAATTAHVGYARYFVTPPVQNVSEATISKFEGTSNAPLSLEDDAPKAERSNYYDVGVSRQVTKPWQVSLDGFYKTAHNLIDEGQFGPAIILSPFNYRVGRVFGSELSSQYTQGGFTAYGNFSWVSTQAHDIDTQQFLIDPAELAYIQDHNIHLDHESEYTASTGVSYAWKNDTVYADLLYGSGLRSGFANTAKVPHYIPVSIGYTHTFHPRSLGHPLTFRVDVINLFDEKYELRTGTGIGVGAPQFGQRFTALAGFTYSF